MLSGARPLSIDIIRALHRHLGIPADVLIGQESPKAVAKPQSPSLPALQKLRELGLMRGREAFDAFMRRMGGPSAAAAHLRNATANSAGSGRSRRGVTRRRRLQARRL